MSIDWQAFEERLHAASMVAIQRFAMEAPDEPICFFAFDTEPRYGYVLIAFDTLANNIRSAMQREKFAVESRQKLLGREDAWEHAKYNLNYPVLAAFATNSGGFAYPQYTEVQFPEWKELAERGGYPVGQPHDDDYLESSVRLILWRVSERLIEENAFNPLRLASPFMIGYGIHDQEESILRILNWSKEDVPDAISDRGK